MVLRTVIHRSFMDVLVFKEKVTIQAPDLQKKNI